MQSDTIHLTKEIVTFDEKEVVKPQSLDTAYGMYLEERWSVQSFAENTNEHSTCEVPKYAKAVSMPKISSDRTRDFHQWIGRIISIGEDDFVAKIEAVRFESPSQIVRFRKNKSIYVNPELMEEGATFYWTVGLFPLESNPSTLVRQSEIHFRFRTPIDIDRAQKEAYERAQRLIEKISWLE